MADLHQQFTSERLEHEQRIERSAYAEAPAIHVIVRVGDEDFFRWVATGAEEEGVPCRLVRNADQDPSASAYVAAHTSRVGVGVAVGSGRAVLQEGHMTVDHPVLTLPLQNEPARICRLMGGNAGRMVKHMPLRFE